MENIKECEICRGNNFDVLTIPKDFLISNEKFSVVKCTKCGFVFTNPRPELSSLSDYYKSDDYISHTDAERTLTERVYKLVKQYMLGKKVRLIRNSYQKPASETTLLDYGCATGEFVLRVKQHGFDAFGYEPDSNARNKAIEKGVKVVDGDLLENHESLEDDRLYDIITLWHVLEHIPDLAQKGILFNKLLKKDGLIVVAVPEFLSFDAKFYKENWAAWDVPRHLNHFNDKTMVQYFGKYGFTLLNIHPLYFDSFYISLLTEKIMNSGLPGLMRAFTIGLVSNIKAIVSQSPFSSQIYIFRKTADTSL
jgi:SAM-dependent methyltransferase